MILVRKGVGASCMKRVAKAEGRRVDVEVVEAVGSRMRKAREGEEEV